MTHFTTPEFWQHYNALPEETRKLADKNFVLLKTKPNHPSLHFKKIGRLWSIRVGMHYRALAFERNEGFLWYWIGSHANYDAFIVHAD